MGFFDFFDNFFGCKKDNREDGTEPPQIQQQIEDPEAQQTPQPEEQNEDQWIYELVFQQYLISPIWKLTINGFLDEHCIVFDDVEENEFSQHDIHKKFKKMMEDLVDGMIAEIGITEEQFGAVVEQGLKSPDHKKHFKQLLIIDNFIVFKIFMIKKNKKNKLQASKELQKQDLEEGPDQAHQKLIKKLELERENADLEYGLEVSRAYEEERKKLIQDNENEFDEAIRLSEFEHREQMEKQEIEEQRLKSSQNQKLNQESLPPQVPI